MSKRNIGEITKENDLTFINDGLDSNEILKIVRDIRRNLDIIEELKIKYSKFIERYPMLFEMSIKDDYNETYLIYFLNKRNDIVKNKISNEDASKQVGQEWFEKFVKL